VRFVPTAVEGAYVVEPAPLEDERGSFARTVDAGQFEERGLPGHFGQWSISYNRRAGTLRGMHYQHAPHEEVKLVRCTAGSVQDVVIDLRRGSPTYIQHESVVLSARNRRALLVPAGCAHGFLTLQDDSELLYGMHGDHEPAAAAGARWDDPAFGIVWQSSPQLMHERDRRYPDHAT
jgi:dTDP-4-dehydrorhamnose 3,5-epimerase